MRILDLLILTCSAARVMTFIYSPFRQFKFDDRLVKNTVCEK